MTNILDKDTFYYSVLHYFVLFLHIFRGLFLAKYLGASAFGLYGIVILAQQQLSASALGMREAVTLKLSGVEEEDSIFPTYIKSALTFTLFIGLILFLLGSFSFLSKDYFENIHPIGGFIYLIFFHGVFSITNEVIINILRIKGQIIIVGLVELLYGISIILWALIIILLERDLALFFQLSLLTNFFVFIFYFSKVFYYINFKTEIKKIIDLLKLGIPLLVLNVSTILMITIGQWMVGIYDNLFSLGIFSFAVSLATIVNYGLGSLTWVYFASLIAEYKTSSKEKISALSDVLRGYLFSAFLILLSIVLIFYSTFVKFFFEEYYASYFAFLMIFFSQFIQLFCYPDSTLLMAKNKINQISILCSFVFSFIGIFAILIYEDIFRLSLDSFSKIDIVSFGVLLGNFLYFFGIFAYANKYKNYDFTKDLSFIIYFFTVVAMATIFNYLNVSLLTIIFLIILLFLFHNKSLLELYKRIKEVF